MRPVRLRLVVSVPVLWLGVCLFVSGLFASALHAQVIISEFVADNTLGRRDDDGDREDWIELFNTSGEAVNLAGWFLTDSANDPREWEFPAVVLGPRQFLIVTASGKDRRSLDRPLHTNFRLAAAGEYLALRKPDLSIATEFAPAYPAQAPDMSYGHEPGVLNVSLLSVEAAGRLWIPADDSLGTQWVRPEFDDAAWTPVVPGIGWEAPGQEPSFGEYLRTDLTTSMRGVNASAFLRFPFVVTQVEDLDNLELRLRYDDGFVAFLNGEPAAQRNARIETTGGVIADSVDDWSGSGEQGVKGWYYGFYDLSADADGVYDAYTDFNNLDARWTWNGEAWSLGPSDPPWTLIARETWHPGGNSGRANVQWAIRRWVSQTAGNVTLLLAVAKENTSCGNGVTVRILVNGRSRYSRRLAYNDSVGISTTFALQELNFGDFVDFALDPTGTNNDTADGCDGSTFAVQVMQEASPGVQWNSTAENSRSNEAAVVREVFNLNAVRDRLKAGTNLLAFQVLNAAADDPDLLLEPELAAQTTTMELGTARYFPTPTPGSPNAGAVASLGPIIQEVVATPAVPADDEDLTIAAYVTRTLRPIASVGLRYRVMFGSEIPLPMRDDGRQGDAVAGDGWWTAVIPRTAFGAGQMIRWIVTATDNGGSSLRSPPYPDPQRSPQYHGTVARDPAIGATRLPVLHWFVQNAAAADSETGARGSLFFDGEFYDNINANIHGQSTRGFPKKSYDFDFHPGHNFRWRRDQPRVDDFNLLTTWADKSHLRNVLAYETYEQAGVPAHFAFAVRVQLNARFHSVANLVENGDDNFLERIGYDPEGALYKMYNTADSVADSEKKTRKNEGTQDLADLIRGFGTGSSQVREAFLFDHLDVPQVINYLATRALTGDSDCCHKNYYLYRDTRGTGEWSAFPWDVDLTFGRVWTCDSPCDAYYDETIYTNSGLFVGENNRIFSTVLSLPSTRQMYLRRLRTLMDEITQPPGVPPSMDRWLQRSTQLRDQIAPDAALDLAKWGTWGRRETITQAVDRIHREFLPGRRQFLFVDRVRSGLIPASQPAEPTLGISAIVFQGSDGNPLQRYVTLTNSNSYAVDLSDWQLSGSIQFRFKPGTVLPARSSAYVAADRRAFRARTTSPRGGERRLVLGDYSGELSGRGGHVVLHDATGRIVAERSFTGEPSAAQRYLRITELMYHAGPPGDGEGIEFVELHNLGPEALDLTGVRFTRGISFDFSTSPLKTLAAGGYVLVVKDPAAFAARYGSGFPVAGSFTGSLDNAGERLRLEDADGNAILDFEYPVDSLPGTDGLGFSLVVADPNASWEAWGLASHWRSGLTVGGTPGSAEALEPLPPVIINEVLAHTDPPALDAVELHNPTSVPADISGWWLSDNREVPAKFRIPANTLIPPNGFVVFTETDFNPANGGTGAFSLSSHGEEIWLFSANAQGQLTGYVDGFAFPASANGESFGRYTNSVGAVQIVAQDHLTLGAPNAGPRIGPVVIQEIHFAPPRGDAPFIELKNLGASPVAFYDPGAPTNTWRVAGVDFAFPRNFVLAPGAVVIVVGGDPETFRQRHGILADVVGPWSGTLQRGGERLALERPDRPDTLNDGSVFVPWIIVDEVHFEDASPWPLTPLHTLGSSIEKKSAGLHGDDPQNWRISVNGPTPGTDGDINRAPVVSAGPAQELASSVYPLMVSLNGWIQDDGLPEDPGKATATWSQLAGPGVVEFSSSLTTNTQAHLPGPGRYILRLTGYDGAASGSADVVVDVTRPGSQPTLVPAGARWRYSDAGTQPAAGWRDSDFNDVTWSEGNAQLGYGDGDESKVIRSSANGSRLLTAYFRHRFLVANPENIRSLTVRLLRDDGAAVWINGREALRSNLPGGTLSYSTLATATVGGTDESLFVEFPISPSLLQSGTNQLAAEVHQQSASSSDLSFDLELIAESQPTNQAPTVSAGPDQSVSLLQPAFLTGSWSDDGLPRAAGLHWVQVDGPATASIDGTNRANATVVLPVPGAYDFELRVHDGEFTVADQVRLTATNESDPYLAWKARHFSAQELANADLSGDTADPDGDGHSNIEEFQAGTLPRDPASVLSLRASLAPDSRLRLVLPGIQGRSYIVQWSSRLMSPVWHVLETTPALPADREVVILDPTPPGAAEPRFYRVFTQAP